LWSNGSEGREAEDVACDVEEIICPKIGIDCNIDEVMVVCRSVMNMMKYVTMGSSLGNEYVVANMHLTLDWYY